MAYKLLTGQLILSPDEIRLIEQFLCKTSTVLAGDPSGILKADLRKAANNLLKLFRKDS